MTPVDPKPHQPPEDLQVRELVDSLRRDLVTDESLTIHRVEQRLQTPSPVPRRPLWIPVGAATAALAALLVLAVLLIRPPVSDGPPVELADVPEAAPGPLVLAAAGDVVSAVTDEKTALVEGGAARATLAPDSVLRRLEDVGQAPALMLEHGTVTVNAEKASLRRLVVEADDVSLVAIGSSFQLERVDDRIAVEVLSGRVEVHHGDERIEIGAGERWQRPSLSVGRGDSKPASENAYDEGLGDARDGAGRLVASPPPPRVNVNDADVAFLALLDARDSGATPDELIVRADAYLSAHPDGHFVEEAEATRLEALADAGRYAEAFVKAGEFCRAHPASPRRTQILWLQATVARDRLKDCELALPVYRELVALEGETAAGAEANYFLAVCALERGLRTEAAQALNRSLAASPDGPYGGPAREMLDGIEDNGGSGTPGE